MIFNEENIREEFEERLQRIKKNWDRHSSSPIKKELIKAMKYLYNICPISFAGFFQDITHWTNPDSIEWWEEINSFLGNFFDDSFIKLGYSQEMLSLLDEASKARNFILKEKDPIPHSPETTIACWKIEWCGDDENFLREKDLIKILYQIAEHEKQIVELQKEFYEGYE